MGDKYRRPRWFSYNIISSKVLIVSQKYNLSPVTCQSPTFEGGRAAVAEQWFAARVSAAARTLTPTSLVGLIDLTVTIRDMDMDMRGTDYKNWRR